MSAPGTQLALAAEALVGTRFRLRGRDPLTGLDCIGVLASALRRIGHPCETPSDYALRQADVSHLTGYAARAGLAEAAGAIRSGDVLIVHPGPAQFHVMIAATGGGFVHAHAGLGRVVTMPPPLGWPVEHHWRLTPA